MERRGYRSSNWIRLWPRENDTWSYLRARDDLLDAQTLSGSSTSIANNLLTAYLGLKGRLIMRLNALAIDEIDLLRSGAAARGPPSNLALASLELDTTLPEGRLEHGRMERMSERRISWLSPPVQRGQMTPGAWPKRCPRIMSPRAVSWPHCFLGHASLAAAAIDSRVVRRCRRRAASDDADAAAPAAPATVDHTNTNRAIAAYRLAAINGDPVPALLSCRSKHSTGPACPMMPPGTFWCGTASCQAMAGDS